MKILVTGATGYIGTLLGPVLIERGHEVVGLDTGFYREGWLFNPKRTTPEIRHMDIRRLEKDDLVGFDAVAHLAELSNDPLGQLKPDITYEINHKGSLALARACLAAGVPRFVYTSSCSVYGVGADDYLTEESETNPQTAYARCKVLVERDIGKMASDDFTPTFLRNATAYGPSPHMRFDIVLNNLAGLARTTSVIKMISDGTPWRPLVHVLDICEAIACALEAPREAVHNEIFNVGHSDHNYRVRDIAEIVADAFPGCELSFGALSEDNRSYRVRFDKIHEQLPGFSCKHDAIAGARQLFELFEQIDLTPERFEYRPFTRLRQLEYLIRTAQVDDHFFWK